jgi:hypothetical protein
VDARGGPRIARQLRRSLIPRRHDTDGVGDPSKAIAFLGAEPDGRRSRLLTRTVICVTVLVQCSDRAAEGGVAPVARPESDTSATRVTGQERRAHPVTMAGRPGVGRNIISRSIEGSFVSDPSHEPSFLDSLSRTHNLVAGGASHRRRLSRSHLGALAKRRYG